MAWWITCRDVSWLFFFFRTMKKESMKSVNLEKKYHQTMLAALNHDYYLQSSMLLFILLESICRVGVVNWLTSPTVFTSQPVSTQSREDPETEEGLKDVVHEHCSSALISWLVLHEGNTSKPENKTTSSNFSLIENLTWQSNSRCCRGWRLARVRPWEAMSPPWGPSGQWRCGHRDWCQC